MTLLEELEILIETRQPYAHGNAEKCYPFVADLIQSLRAAQQGVQADLANESENKVDPVTQALRNLGSAIAPPSR